MFVDSVVGGGVGFVRPLWSVYELDEGVEKSSILPRHIADYENDGEDLFVSVRRGRLVSKEEEGEGGISEIDGRMASTNGLSWRRI